MPGLKILFLQVCFWGCVFFLPLVFAGSVLITMSDAQGGFVFLISLPMMLAMLTISGFSLYFLRLCGRRTGWWRFLPALEGVYLVLFFLGAFVPRLGFFPDFTFRTLSSGFQRATGMTPYQWVRRSHTPPPGQGGRGDPPTQGRPEASH